MRRDERLRAVAGEDIGAEQMFLCRAVMDGEPQRVTGMPQPEFGGIDAVPVRALTGFEQEQDRGGEAASAVWRGLSECFAIPAAFGMRRELQSRDDRRYV